MNNYTCQVDCPSIVNGRWKEISRKRLAVMKTKRTTHPQSGMIVLWNREPELVLRATGPGRFKTKDKKGQLHHRQTHGGGVSVIPELFTKQRPIEEERETL